MIYNRQWTQFETQMSVFGNLRKAFGDKYTIRGDYGQIFFWTKDEQPVCKAIFFVEASLSPQQQAVNELTPQEGIRRFRICGATSTIAESFKNIL